MAQCGDPTIAARLCDNSYNQGYSDWYLPAKGQLDDMYNNKTDIDKLYIGRLNYKKTPYYVKTYKKGNKLTVKGVSSRGTKTTDIYTLKGFTAAFNQLQNDC